MSKQPKPMKQDAVMAVALAHAAKVWCWDDVSFITELMEKQPDVFLTEQQVKTCIDELADDYELTPRSAW